MQKKLTVLFAFAIFVLVMGWAITPVQADPPPHNHGGGGGGEPPIEPCLEFLCIADVGRTGNSDTPASQFGGTYTKIESNQFDQLLQALPDSLEILCAAFDVLIFNWNSPKIKNLNWQRLLDYMDCGGGIIFEDTRNVLGLAPDVSIIESTRSSKDDEPITITLDATAPTELTAGFGSTATFVNKHIIFDEPNNGTNVGLTPFLTLPDDNDRVVGLYGEFDDDSDGVSGRIVLTGPDNNFHGRAIPTHEDPAISEAIRNSYDLLFNEIDWLLAP